MSDVYSALQCCMGACFLDVCCLEQAPRPPVESPLRRISAIEVRLLQVEPYDAGDDGDDYEIGNVVEVYDMMR
jgi:hypothetical protein